MTPEQKKERIQAIKERAVKAITKGWTAADHSNFMIEIKGVDVNTRVDFPFAVTYELFNFITFETQTITKNFKAI